MIRLLIVPVTAWIVHGVALARARRTLQNSVNLALTLKSRGDGGRCDAP